MKPNVLFLYSFVIVWTLAPAVSHSITVTSQSGYQVQTSSRSILDPKVDINTSASFTFIAHPPMAETKNGKKSPGNSFIETQNFLTEIHGTTGSGTVVSTVARVTNTVGEEQVTNLNISNTVTASIVPGKAPDLPVSMSTTLFDPIAFDPNGESFSVTASLLAGTLFAGDEFSDAAGNIELNGRVMLGELLDPLTFFDSTDANVFDLFGVEISLGHEMGLTPIVSFGSNSPVFSLLFSDSISAVEELLRDAFLLEENTIQVPTDIELFTVNITPLQSGNVTFGTRDAARSPDREVIEPPTALLLLFGLAGLAGVRKIATQ